MQIKKIVLMKGKRYIKKAPGEPTDQRELDSIRIASLISEQKSLIKAFKKTGDLSLVARFNLLVDEFNKIHERHKNSINSI